MESTLSEQHTDLGRGHRISSLVAKGRLPVAREVYEFIKRLPEDAQVVVDYTHSDELGTSRITVEWWE